MNEKIKILEIPKHYNAMKSSVSMSGITVLKQSNYKFRHSGYKEIIQVPKSGFITKKEYKRINPPVLKIKKSTRVIKQDDKKRTERKKKVCIYSINRKEVRNRILQYVNQMSGEKLLFFWTITFPINTTDDNAFILLNKWLTRLRAEGMLKEYIWIAERQQNNTIHFHMVINRRMDIKRANLYMRASIMYSIKRKEINWDYESAKNYNGIDIAKNRKSKRVVNFAKAKCKKQLIIYLTKYISKNTTTFPHLAWHGSREYSNLIIAFRLTEEELCKSNLKHLLNFDNPLEGEYYLHYSWLGSTPINILKYFSTINQYCQSLLI